MVHRFRLNCCSYSLSEYVGSCVGQVVFQVVCKYFLPFGDVGCTSTSVPISWVEVLEVLRMLDAKVLPISWVEMLEVVLTHSMLYHPSDKLAAQVLVCLPMNWVEVLEVLRMLDEQVLVYLSVGLKCWKFCWESCANTLYASTIFPCSLKTSWLPSYLCACLSVGLKVLEVLLGKL